MKNWYQFLTFVKIKYQFFTSEKNRTSPSKMAQICTNSAQLKTRKMWNLSTDVRPPKLSKLTIRKFHIFQKWHFGTNSSHGVKFAKCEICGSAQLLSVFEPLEILNGPCCCNKSCITGKICFRQTRMNWLLSEAIMNYRYRQRLIVTYVRKFKRVHKWGKYFEVQNLGVYI